MTARSDYGDLPVFASIPPPLPPRDVPITPQGKNIRVKDNMKIAYYILFILAIISIMIFLGSLVLGIGIIGSSINMILIIFLVWLVKDWSSCPEYKKINQN